ncbi:hypothetical protein SAY86_020799 [Trapa natans]|uniref:Protein kinase domain-containing protein n=1 Tax=Trapa natans TaxID=22666 RepID=A0AAN7REA9_TRANT|nr:hypothetical protein SAY86_020799 [Trapa natans]
MASLASLKRLDEGFQYINNQELCGFGFPSLRVCASLDSTGIGDLPFGVDTNKSISGPQTVIYRTHSSHSQVRRAALIAGALTAAIALILTGSLAFYRPGKQKIVSTIHASESRHSIDQSKFICSPSASPLVSLEYASRWGSLDNGLYRNGLGMLQQVPLGYRFTLEEVESATHYFSEANLLGKSNVSAVYKGVLRNGSLVAIRNINLTSCKTEEADFVNGLNLLTSLRHENLIPLRGFCCSKGKGECYLVYDFAPKGDLSKYLDLEDGSSQALIWSTRVSIIKGIAKGIGYLHCSEGKRPPVVHQNISAEKILLDQQLNPLIMDSGLPRLVADDVIFSTLKISAAMGCLAPEYITTGRFTDKSDVYAFGVIVFQILSGKLKLTSSMRLAPESCHFRDFIDPNLSGNFTEAEAEKLTRIALDCTAELPERRPSILRVIHELGSCGSMG